MKEHQDVKQRNIVGVGRAALSGRFSMLELEFFPELAFH